MLKLSEVANPTTIVAIIMKNDVINWTFSLNLSNMNVKSPYKIANKIN